MPGTVRALSQTVDFNGTTLTQVLGWRWSLGYDLAVGEASITLPVVSGAGTYYDDVTITVDGHDRWSGMLVQWDYSLYPRSVTMICKGRLDRARQYRLPNSIPKDKGLALADLIGTTAGATDQAIVQAVLDYIGLSTNGGSIGGTGTVMGTIAKEEFTWQTSESALDYIQKIDSISLGYRTFETAGGAIFRSQISSRPSGSFPLGDHEFEFTEGVDIREGSTNRTVQEAYNAVRVSGYAVGDYADPRVFYIAETNPFQGGSNPNRVFEFTNSMIERRANVSPGLGMSCESMCNYWLGELNREIVKVSMTTPRMDVYGPGQIHLVQGPGGAPDRLGVGENFWTQRVDGTYDTNGALSHTFAYIGGGT